jgi:hypothetical protein
LVNNADNLTYNRLAKKFAGLNTIGGPANPQTQGVAPEQINSIQSRIQSAQESIQNQRQTDQQIEDGGDHYLNKLLEITGNNQSPSETNNLEMFKNVINDPRFSNITQKPAGMSDSGLLKLFPNIKGLIESDPSKEEVFLDNLNKLSNTLDIRTTSSQATHADSTSSLINKSQVADSDTKKLVSASFLNMIGNNQGLVDALAKSGPRIFVGDISSSGSGGWYSSDKNMILPMIGTRAGSEQINLAGFSKVASHELGHWIDHADGNIDGFSSMLGQGFQNLRSQVYQGISRGSFDHLNDNYEKYATTNPQEFFAVMGQFFVNNPLAMKDDMPEMYGLFARAYNMDTSFDTGLTSTYSGAPIVASTSQNSNSTRNSARTVSSQTNTNSSSRSTNSVTQTNITASSRSRSSNSTISSGRSSSTTSSQTQSGTGTNRISRSRFS